MKLIASDFDGTFHSGDPRDAEAVARWQAAGHAFAFATGRNYPGACGLMDVVPCDMVIASTGGQLIGHDRKICYEVSCDSAMLPRVIDFTRRYNAIYFHCTCGAHEYLLREMPQEHSPAERTTPYAEMASLPPFQQINTRFDTDADAAAFCTALAAAFPTELAPAQNGTAVDIPAAGVSKVTGIRKAAALLGVAEEDIYTVGDNYNDIPMLRAFHGYAVENAVGAAKQAAFAVVPSVAALIDSLLADA